MITQEELQEWKNLIDATTPEPWIATISAAFIVNETDNGEITPICAFSLPDNTSFPNSRSNSAFIVKARSGVKNLLAEIERLQGEVEQLKEFLSESVPGEE